MIEYYNRKTKQITTEQEYQKKSLHFLYHTPAGRFLLWSFIARPWFSRLKGVYQSSKFSKKSIRSFVKKYNMDINKKDMQKYRSFNDFFSRTKQVNEWCDEDDVFISPADCKLSFFHIDDNLRFNVKHSSYNVAEILNDNSLAREFSGGTCIVCRLCVDDYHRYHFVDDGKVILNKKIKGQLHTVRPVSAKYNVFTRNAREVSIIETEHFGKIAYVEVGALLVGKINNHKNKIQHKRCDEKGYFEFGGSTIVILTSEKIKFDADIADANKKGYETKVSIGERIGKIC